MSKFVVITLTKNQAGNTVFPQAYNPQEVDRNKTGPILSDKGFERGEQTEERMLFLADLVADAYGLDPDMRVLSQIEADTWIRNNPALTNEPEEQITDPDRLLAIMAKALAAGAPALTLSAEDQDALNPEDPMKGIELRTKDAAGFYGV